MTVDCMIEDPRWQQLALESLAQTAAGAVFARLRLDPAAFEISLLACDDARIAALNADFRGKPQPTNVLSWPAADLAPARPGGRPRLPAPGRFGVTELGDIAIAYDTCLREAGVAERPMRDHVLHLLVHGMLHLLGYDHESDQDATLMEGLETEILGKMGLSDPYEA